MQIAVAVAYLTGVYVLLALGYVIVYRASRVLNLAHGDVMALGGYLLLAVGGLMTGLPLLAALVVAVLGCVLGVVVYRLIIRPLAGYPTFIVVLMTIALAFFLRGLITFVWTTTLYRPAFELGLDLGAVSLPGARITIPQLATIVIALLLYGGLLVAFRRSTIGVQMRAVAENPRLAAHRGISINRIYAMSWAVAAGTAMLAGMLHGVSVFLTPNTAIAGLKAFPVALIGGLDSLEGVLPAAVLVALAEQMTILYVSPILGEVMPFILMLAILVVRPWGLFGTTQELERI